MLNVFNTIMHFFMLTGVTIMLEYHHYYAIIKCNNALLHDFPRSTVQMTHDNWLLHLISIRHCPRPLPPTSLWLSPFLLTPED